MATIKVTDKNFEAEVLKAGKPVLLDFWAPWCLQSPYLNGKGTRDIDPRGPCNQLAPVLEEISEEFSDKLIVAKANADEELNILTVHNVRGLPTMILFSEKGEIISTKVGASPKSHLVEWLNSELNK